MPLAGVVALYGLGIFGASAASAAPGYRPVFASTVDNAAVAGPLIIKGHRLSTADPMMADQIIELSDGSQITRPHMGQLIYEEYPDSLSHRHWHQSVRPLPAPFHFRGPADCPPRPQGWALSL